MKPRRLPRPNVRRAVLALPSGLTLGNLFFGIFAIISASRGEFFFAVQCVVYGGICDALDGRVARATRSGSQFGEELDSLVDAISFGFAPAMIIYFSTLNRSGWAWVFVFLFTACAVMRLARFNVTQAGEAKSHFIGLPSPAAGGTLATYYWFSQSDLYRLTPLGNLPWDRMVPWLMAGLAFLMISDVAYPAWPKIGLRSVKGLAGLAVVLGIVLGVIIFRSEFFFPFGILYVLFGLSKDAILGLLERAPAPAGSRWFGTDRAELREDMPPRAGAGAAAAARVPAPRPSLEVVELVDEEAEFADEEEVEDERLSRPESRADGSPARRRRKRRRGPRGGPQQPNRPPIEGPNE
jgi:CDP-diacylglycerol---serine O-phosphatidyltransferase